MADSIVIFTFHICYSYDYSFPDGTHSLVFLCITGAPNGTLMMLCISFALILRQKTCSAYSMSLHNAYVFEESAVSSRLRPKSVGLYLSARGCVVQKRRRAPQLSGRRVNQSRTELCEAACESETRMRGRTHNAHSFRHSMFADTFACCTRRAMTKQDSKVVASFLVASN